MKIKDYFVNNIFPVLKKITRKNSKLMNILKIAVICMLVVGLLFRTQYCLYEEYVGN